MQSGSAFNVWAFNKRHKEIAYKLAKLLGCEHNNPKKIVEYLLQVPAVDLVKFTSSKLKIEVCTNKYFILCI